MPMAGTLRRSLLALCDRWRVWLPSMLLVSIACTQIVLARAADLSPWKGGGFGMFATIDGTSTRYVRLYVRAPERSEEVAMQSSFEDAAARAQLCPSRSLMTRLANVVAARERRYGRAVTSVTVQVWRTTIEGSALRATDRLLRELSVDVAQSTAHRP
jgi:hypothetical protein